jgi:hypothetical protein
MPLVGLTRRANSTAFHAGRDAFDDVDAFAMPRTEDVDERLPACRKLEHDFAADGRDADALPYLRCRRRHLQSSRRAWRIGSRNAGVEQGDRPAPMVKMSRMMPPTPVAAP